MTQMNLDLAERPSARVVLDRIRAESRDESEKGRWFDWSEREALTGLDGGGGLSPDHPPPRPLPAGPLLPAAREQFRGAGRTAVVLTAIRTREPERDPAVVASRACASPRRKRSRRQTPLGSRTRRRYRRVRPQRLDCIAIVA